MLRRKDERYTIYDLEGKEFVLSVTYLYPGKSTLGHRHYWEEGYYISKGFGIMDLGGRVSPVKEGEFILVPPDVFHRLQNQSPNPLVAVCAWGRAKR